MPSTAGLPLAAWAEHAARVGDAVLGRLRSPLAELVERTSRVYTREREDFAPASAKDALHARLRFYLVRDLPKLAGPVHELALGDALPGGSTWRVLDLGAGVGTTTFSFLAGAMAAGAAPERVVVDAVDQTPLALRAFAALAEGAPGLPPLEVAAHSGDALRFVEGATGGWDVVLMGLFVNELPYADRQRLLDLLAQRLRPGGTVLILEPALRETSRALHRLRDELAAGWGVYAPCLRTGPCPMLETERDWCHEEELLTLPPALESVARGAGLRGDRLRYSYLTLRRDERTLRGALDADDGWRIVSQALKSKGKLEVYGCADPGRIRFTRLDRHAADPNAAFGEARRGQVLRIEGAEPKGKGRRLGADAQVERIR